MNLMVKVRQGRRFPVKHKRAFQIFNVCDLTTKKKNQTTILWFFWKYLNGKKVDSTVSYPVIIKTQHTYSVLFSLIQSHSVLFSTYSVLFSYIQSYSISFDLIQSYSVLFSLIWSYFVSFSFIMSSWVFFCVILTQSVSFDVIRHYSAYFSGIRFSDSFGQARSAQNEWVRKPNATEIGWIMSNGNECDWLWQK